MLLGSGLVGALLLPTPPLLTWLLTIGRRHCGEKSVLKNSDCDARMADMTWMGTVRLPPCSPADVEHMADDVPCLTREAGQLLLRAGALGV